MYNNVTLTTYRKLGESSLRAQGKISPSMLFWYNQMSSFNWHLIFFNLTVLPFCAWTETIILATNNLFGFIFTTGFGDSSIFRHFRRFRRSDLVSFVAFHFFFFE